MAFIPLAPNFVKGVPLPQCVCSRRPRHYMALSGSEWRNQRAQQDDSQWPWVKDPSSQPTSEYHGWSSDFLELCDSQLQLLLSTVPQVSQVLLFFRRENPSTGDLEFVPLVVHSRHDDGRQRRVWISAPGTAAEVESIETSHVLPGGIPATWILPDYPFKTVGEQGGIVMPDGGLCIPVEYNGVVAGSLVLCPDTSYADHVWALEDVKRADMVAKSIALAAGLEGKWQASAGTLETGKSLIDSMRVLLRTTLHQVRSPVSALVTFGHLLLRKLPPGDSNRALAKNIVLEALRVDDLLKPLDEAGDAHVLPEAVNGNDGNSSRGDDRDKLQPSTARQAEVVGAGFQGDVGKLIASPSVHGMQMLWLSDLLQPQAEISRVLAGERGIKLVIDIDVDTPPVMAVEKYIREAVSNLVDNALKYSPQGSYVGISCTINDTDDDQADVVTITVWDTGYGLSEEDQMIVWDFGQRGSAAERSGTEGSGIGLSAVREMIQACGAQITQQSPLPQHLDPRDPSEKSEELPGSAFFLYFNRAPR